MPKVLRGGDSPSKPEECQVVNLKEALYIGCRCHGFYSIPYIRRVFMHMHFFQKRQ